MPNFPPLLWRGAGGEVLKKVKKMKRSVIIFSVLAVIVCFATCKKDEKSKECNIETFTVNSETWSIEGLNITKTYAKGTSVNNLTPAISVSKGAKWTSLPQGPSYDFSDDKTVTFTVTAEDGKATKRYTAKATVSNDQ